MDDKDREAYRAEIASLQKEVAALKGAVEDAQRKAHYASGEFDCAQHRIERLEKELKETKDNAYKKIEKARDVVTRVRVDFLLRLSKVLYDDSGRNKDWANFDNEVGWGAEGMLNKEEKADDTTKPNTL